MLVGVCLLPHFIPSYQGSFVPHAAYRARPNVLGLYHACISIVHLASGYLSLWRIRNFESHPVFHQTYWELSVYGLFTKTKQNSRASPINWDALCLITLVNTQNVSATKIVDSSSIQ